MRFAKKHVAPLLMVMAGLVACHNGSGGTGTAPTQPMSYMVGDSNEVYVNNGGKDWVLVESATVPGHGIKCGLTSCTTTVGNDLMVSKDLKTWETFPKNPTTQADSPESSLIYDRVVLDLTDGNNLIVTVGAKGQILVGSETMRDANGRLYPMEKVNSNTSEDLYAVTFDYSSKQFIAVGTSGTIVEASVNELGSWRNNTNASEKRDLYAVYCGNSAEDPTCTIVGRQGATLFSTDAYSWRSVNNSTSSSFYAITSSTLHPESQPLMQIAGGKQQIYYSYNHLNWLPAKIPATVNGQSYSIYEMIYTDSRFFARVALADGNDATGVLVSENGITWDFFDINDNTASGGGKEINNCDVTRQHHFCKTIHVMGFLSQFIFPTDLEQFAQFGILLLDGSLDAPIKEGFHTFRVKTKEVLEKGFYEANKFVSGVSKVFINGISVVGTEVGKDIVTVGNTLLGMANTVGKTLDNVTKDIRNGIVDAGKTAVNGFRNFFHI